MLTTEDRNHDVMWMNTQVCVNVTSKRCEHHASGSSALIPAMCKARATHGKKVSPLMRTSLELVVTTCAMIAPFRQNSQTAIADQPHENRASISSCSAAMRYGAPLRDVKQYIAKSTLQLVW